MKILLKSITMINFMGETHRKTEFNLDAPTVISGANGLGKSRHMDAFTWLLFGKDSADRENYEIKTLVDGVQLRHCDPSVEAELVIDGELVTIKRTFEEQWVKPRGCAEAQFKGNQTKCMWNGVPVKVTDFQERINKIIDASIFKMLTNPLYFATLPWKTMREQLFQLAGEIKPADIANGNPRFLALLDRLTGKSLEDYKKELSFRKSELKSRLKEIQPRIDQTHSLMPAAADFDAVQREIDDIDAAIAECDRQISDVTAAVRAAYQAEQSKIDQVNKIRLQMSDVIHQAETAARDLAHRNNQSRRDHETAAADLERQADAMEREHNDNIRRIERINADIKKTEALRANVEAERDAFRLEVIAEKSKKYDGSHVCPCCGQALPADRIAAAESEFAASQLAKITAMVERGKQMNATIERYTTIIADDTAERDELAARDAALVNDMNAKRADARAERAKMMPEEQPAAVVPSNIPEWVELNARAEAIQATIDSSVTATADTSALTSRKGELNAKRAELSAIIANRETIARCNDEIKRLETSAADLAQQIADIEKDEFTIQEFTAANITECERRINGMFHNVTFRLFEYTIEGNASETCVPLVNGVPFGRANTAGRINAGLDIINALCRQYDTDAPIFLDNAESVNNFIETNGQVIMMRVTTDPELIIK